MTFLAPWAFAIAALGAAGMVVLHLVARQRPAAYVLPTARFIPDKRTLVSRIATTPRDLLLLLLRVLILLAAGAAFARPVLTPARAPMGRVILVDVSGAQAELAAARSRVAPMLAESVPTTVIAFDTIGRIVTPAALDSLSGSKDRVQAPGSVSAALLSARRAGAQLAERADSVSLVLVSPVAANELDAATASLRRAWPGGVRVERTPLRADSAIAWGIERRVSVNDPLGPALITVPQSAGTASVRLMRGALVAADSAAARSGATIVRWDSLGAGSLSATGLAVGDDVIVAPLARLPVSAGGRTIARWADGSPAAAEWTVGSGCVRQVGIGLPSAGDLPLHPPFQAIVRGLVASCNRRFAYRAAPDSVLTALEGTRTPALASAFGVAPTRPSTLARWLLIAAMLLALAELAVRSSRSGEQAA